MTVLSLDHLVLAVRDVPASLAYYETHLGLERREERPGKWALHFGEQKISLQKADDMPVIAEGTTPGSGNFCLLSAEPVAALADRLRTDGVQILDGPTEKMGAAGPILSIYFNDPDGNLVEVSNRL